MSKNNSQAIETTIKNRIYGHDRGWCLTPKHFRGLGTEGAVRIALYRLTKAGMIRRLTQGLYEYPRVHEKLGFLPPSVDKVAQAISERDNIKIQPSGAYAANLLGLSEQVPSRVVFITDGPSKKLKIGKTEIAFKKTTAKNMVNAGTLLGLILQALKHIGKDHLTKPQIQRLKKHLFTIDEKNLNWGIRHASAWTRKVIAETILGKING